MERLEPDWDPRSSAVLEDQRKTYDAMRRRCPVAFSDDLGWSLFRHADILRVLEDHELFSNAVSRHRSVPNGLDQPEHTVYRQAIEPLLTSERIDNFEPRCRDIADTLIDNIDLGSSCNFLAEFATPYSLHCQSGFVGWPTEFTSRIADWARRSRQATLARDRSTLAQTAREFQECVDEVLAMRRGEDKPVRDDVIACLMRTSVDGKPLSDEDTASILRNWTVGELASLVAALGIVAYQLAADPALQARLREDPTMIPGAIDECLRADGPLVCNRRVATREVEFGDRHIAAGEYVTLMWVSADRDEAVFDDPAEVRLGRDNRDSLLWGAGIHVCPGAPLARLELRVAVEELLKRSRLVSLSSTPPQRAVYPTNGWATLDLVLS